MNKVKAHLRVENVTKEFDGIVAVKDLSFEIEPGRVFGFLGPNGAGKSTTIRMIVGITYPDSGEVTLFGESISPSVQNRIGYLPEERGLYKKMLVCDQLKYFAALKGINGKEAEKRVDYWLERMKLSDWKKKKASDLSKGMSQKIQFIAAVIHDPDLLILDEPFSGLDPVNVEFMKEVIAELKASDKTIIFSTHLMETAEKLCDDILLINKSEKVIYGSLRRIKEQFGRNIVSVRCIGGEEVFENEGIVARINKHSDDTDVYLAPDGDAQLLLRQLVDSGAHIDKFELVEPSLNDIFIQEVTENE